MCIEVVQIKFNIKRCTSIIIRFETQKVQLKNNANIGYEISKKYCNCYFIKLWNKTYIYNFEVISASVVFLFRFSDKLS